MPEVHYLLCSSASTFCRGDKPWEDPIKLKIEIMYGRCGGIAIPMIQEKYTCHICFKSDNAGRHATAWKSQHTLSSPHTIKTQTQIFLPVRR